MDARRGGLGWRRSSYCTGADHSCVEVAIDGENILVRDSKEPDGPALCFTWDEWRAFLRGAAAGDFS